MKIDHNFQIELTPDTRFDDVRDMAWQHYRDLLADINRAELARINTGRPSPVALNAEHADRICSGCDGATFILGDDDVFNPCPTCAETGVDTAVLHYAAE